MGGNVKINLFSGREGRVDMVDRAPSCLRRRTTVVQFNVFKRQVNTPIPYFLATASNPVFSSCAM